MVRSNVHKIAREVMSSIAKQLCTRGSEFEKTTAHIEKISTHGMRHTAGTHRSGHVYLKLARDNLGHTNLATTIGHVHFEYDQRHDSTSHIHYLGRSAP